MEEIMREVLIYSYLIFGVTVISIAFAFVVTFDDVKLYESFEEGGFVK